MCHRKYNPYHWRVLYPFYHTPRHRPHYKNCFTNHHHHLINRNYLTANNWIGIFNFILGHYYKFRNAQTDKIHFQTTTTTTMMIMMMNLCQIHLRAMGRILYRIFIWKISSPIALPMTRSINMIWKDWSSSPWTLTLQVTILCSMMTMKKLIRMMW